jgi:hypothetical protein
MPSNDDTIESAGALDSFLIDASPAVGPRRVAGLDDVLAVPPVPAEPPARVAAADLPILPAFSIEADATPDLGDSIIANLAAGVEEGRGGHALPALAANPLDDELLADPSALLAAVPPAGPAVEGGERPDDRLDPWSSSPWSSPLAASPFPTAGREAGFQGFGSFDARPGGDDRSPGGPEAIDRIEGRLSQAVARLEEAVAALSAPGPPPLGSRPRGFRGRIDA